MSASHETRFANEMRKKLNYEMENVRDLLTGGALLSLPNPESFVTQSARAMGYARGLVYALECIEVAEEEMFGKPKKEKAG